ncbi:MAG: prolipoprotein diacylglyceryl transferase [Butyricicoccus sp.]|nr:prolipoprotein diacylglyceryl transferase [Butyricicoccus sp.]
MREAVISFPMFGEGFTLDPPACLSIGSFNIYLYGIVIAVGFLLAVLYVDVFHERLRISMDDVYDLTIFAVLSAIVGARLYYVVFNDLPGYLSDPVSILRIRDGGLAIYGGVIGAAVALVLRCRSRKIAPGKALDVAALGLLIGQCVGRWGNFFNREAFGYETDVFCRMGLTAPGRETVYVHPTFLYESLWNFAGLILLHFFCKKRRKYEGQLFILYLGWYGLGRMFIEGLRSDSLWLVPDVIRVSQLLAAVSLLCAVIIFALNERRIKAGNPPLLGTMIPEGEGAQALDRHDIIEAPENQASEQETPPETDEE